MAELPALDAVVHAPIRLATMTLLNEVDEAEFTWLRERVGATDGNLSVHLSKLEEAGYIAVSKRFEERKPRSFYRLTDKGRSAFLRYLATLRTLLGKNISGR